jgi:uncharacterized RDD family membrane protein YckC
MDRKNIYTAICIGMGVVFANSLFWMGRFIITAGLRFYDGSFWINSLFTLLGITGLIIFAASGFRNSALLRLFMCKVVAFLPNTILYQYIFFTSPQKNTADLMMYIGTFLTLTMVVSSIAGLWILTRERVPKLTHYMIGTDSVAEFAAASAWSRLGNYVIDVLLAFYMAYSFLQTAKYQMILNRSYQDFSYSRSQFPVEILPLTCVLLYYFILEGIFNTSAGKCATNTIIVNSFGQVPSVGQRLGRTLCRLIPFEAFSFFSTSRRGWHDTITDTYVSNSIDKYAEKKVEDELAGFLSNEEAH